MIGTVIVLVELTKAHTVKIEDAFPDTNLSQSLMQCEGEKILDQKCYLLQQRDKKTLVFTDLRTNRQLIVEK